MAIELAPFVKKVVGVDVSQGMLDVFTERAVAAGIAAGKISTVRAELTDAPSKLGGERFDVVLVRPISLCSIDRGRLKHRHSALLHTTTLHRPRISRACSRPSSRLPARSSL